MYEITLFKDEANICLPTDLDTTNFEDITCRADIWKKYLDVNTGVIHNCAEYYKQHLKMRNLEK